MKDPLVSKVVSRVQPLSERVVDRFAAGQEQEETEASITRPGPASEHEAVTPPGWEGPVKEMKKDKDIDNPWALAWYMKNKGDQPHKKASEEEAPTPEEDHWNHWEKRGEWNLNVYKRNTRWDYFMKNPKGGGGGSSSYPSMAAAIATGMRVGWTSPHINPEGKTKAWVTILKWDPMKGPEGDWVPQKSEWKDAPKA